VGVAFLCLVCPNKDGLHFIPTKMGYISLPSNMNAIIGIKSYYCVMQKMVILHDAIKHFRIGFCDFYEKEQIPVSLKKKRLKKQKSM